MMLRRRIWNALFLRAWAALTWFSALRRARADRRSLRSQLFRDQPARIGVRLGGSASRRSP